MYCIMKQLQEPQEEFGVAACEKSGVAFSVDPFNFFDPLSHFIFMSFQVGSVATVVL